MLLLLYLLTGTPVGASPTILVLGDSLSAAYGMDQEQGWVSLLENRLRENASPWRVINASVSGETSSGGLARLPDLLARYPAGLCIIELGANDGMRGLDLGRLRAQLAEMIKLCRQSGAEVLLIGMKLPPNYGAHYTGAFEQVFSTLAAMHEVRLVPFLLEGVALDPAAMQEDGLHPNTAAQPRLLETVWRVLGPLLDTLHPAPGHPAPQSSGAAPKPPPEDL